MRQYGRNLTFGWATLGFELEDKKLRRAGLDYHEWANVKVHANWQDAWDGLSPSGVQRIVALTTKLNKPLYDEDFTQLANIALYLGQRQPGYPSQFARQLGKTTGCVCPMLRPLAVWICLTAWQLLFEVWRQQGLAVITVTVSVMTIIPYDPK